MVPQEKLNINKSFLPENYVPSEFDVLCGRGVECFRHSGNATFRQTVDDSVSLYATALSKQKSIVVLDVIKQARSKSSEPAKFIRLCLQKSCWYEITEETVRQKVAQTLREALIQRDPEKRALKNKKRAKKRAIRVAAKYPGPPERAVSAPAHAKQLQRTASHENPSLTSVLPIFRCIPDPASFLLMRAHASSRQTSLADLVDESLECMRPLLFPATMSSSDWFTVGGVVEKDCGDSDLSSVFGDWTSVF